MTDDGSSVLAGSTRGDWNATNMGESDCAACKLNADGKLLWKWQVIDTEWSSRATRFVGLSNGDAHLNKWLLSGKYPLVLTLMPLYLELGHRVAHGGALSLDFKTRLSYQLTH